MFDPADLPIEAGARTSERTISRVVSNSGARSSRFGTSSAAGAAMKRYTMVIEPAAHPEARRELVVEARDDGDAYDQAADHVSAELPYRCTIIIATVEETADGAAVGRHHFSEKQRGRR